MYRVAGFKKRSISFLVIYILIFCIWFIHLGVLLYKYWDPIRLGEISPMLVAGHCIYMIPILLLVEVFRLGYEVIRSKDVSLRIFAGIVAALDLLIGVILVMENWEVVVCLLAVPTLWSIPVDMLFTGLEWSAVILCSVYLVYYLLLNWLKRRIP